MQMLRFSLTLGILLLSAAPVLAAPDLQIVSRFVPEEGLIADAAIFADGTLALAFPDRGRIALHNKQGKLERHILREAGESLPFQPTTLANGPRDTLLVFDEVDHKLFTVSQDGNVTKGVDLAYPAASGTGALALSRIGDLSRDTSGRIWAMLPDRSMLAAFDDKGVLTDKLDLSLGLPYPGAIFTRAQFVGDGTLFVLDYHQGAVLYRAQGARFKRIRPPVEMSSEAEPVLQDFAVDAAGNVLATAAGGTNPVLYMAHSAQGYKAHPLKLDLPAGANRLAVRQSQGKFILWLRNKPLAYVLSLR
jgi:hypothetical protein